MCGDYSGLVSHFEDINGKIASIDTISIDLGCLELIYLAIRAAFRGKNEAKAEELCFYAVLMVKGTLFVLYSIEKEQL